MLEMSKNASPAASPRSLSAMSSASKRSGLMWYSLKVRHVLVCVAAVAAATTSRARRISFGPCSSSNTGSPAQRAAGRNMIDASSEGCRYVRRCAQCRCYHVQSLLWFETKQHRR